MNKMRKPIYFTAGYNTVSFGSGRKEFHPKKPRPGLEHYINEAGKGVIDQINDAANVDEGVIGNFMAARFNKQGNLASLMANIHPSFEYKPMVRVEGACGSGGLALTTSVKTILSDLSDVVLAVGVEVQNSVKAIYGADILGGAGHYTEERKEGHAYFFPSKFSDRAGACYEKFDKDTTRQAMARWYEQAILNARKNPKAQEYHNTTEDLFAAGMTSPNPKLFCDHINVFDCSKVSDGASALIIASEEGLNKLDIPKSKAIELLGFGVSVADLTKPPVDLTKMTTVESATKKAYEMAGLGPKDIGILEIHDCFTIGGILELEATGFAEYGKGTEFVLSGKTHPEGEIPTNATGGLIGFGHYTGGTGVREAVDLVHQLTGQAGDCQVNISADRPYGLMVSMGGNDRTVVSCIFKHAS
ncbi:MAG: thiolase C-terminal domain-containing protein [Candidatus Aminicenantaceae bacterium]